MKISVWIGFFILLIITCGAHAELITLGALGAIGGTLSGYLFRCSYMECCDDNEIPYNTNALKDKLDKKVYGQPMVNEIVPILQGHISNFKKKTGHKALTLSFHGWTGCGKNHVASLIADSLYKRGMASKFVKLYIGRHHFPSPLRVAEYREQVAREIQSIVKSCPNALIIFDEVNEIPPGVIDIITPMVDHHHEIDGVDYRGAVFVFLSNVGGNEITNRFIELNKPREEVLLSDFENVLREISYSKGGFKESRLLTGQYIDHYIPFLPLEARHVKKCTEAEFRIQGNWNPTSKMIDDVLSTITYGPKELMLYANAGCKRIKKQVTYVLRKSQTAS